MKRIQCLQKSDNRIKIEQHNNYVIKNIPSNAILDILINCYSKVGRDRISNRIIAKVETFNLLSIRFQVLASQDSNAYPFYNDIGRTPDKLRHHREAIKFLDIIEWKPFPIEELPLLMGWAIMYPYASDLLKG
jgi:hypothetical protein